MTVPWSRVNTVLLLLIGIGVLALLATRAYGGPLDPSGPPGATDGVRRAGTPISSLPSVITQPGYYYVTRPLTGGTSQPGITVSTSNVTIDLNGFTLTGGTTPGAGITIAGYRNVVIENGAVRSWDDGIDAFGCGNCRIERVQSSSNQNLGMKVGQNTTVINCNASLNVTGGILLQQGTVRDCTFSENGSYGVSMYSNAVVEGSRFRSNGFGVIANEVASTLRASDLSGNGTDILVTGDSASTIVLDTTYCTVLLNSLSLTFVNNILRPGC